MTSEQDSGCGRNEWNAAITGGEQRKVRGCEGGWRRSNAELANNDEGGQKAGCVLWRHLNGGGGGAGNRREDSRVYDKLGLAAALGRTHSLANKAAEGGVTGANRSRLGPPFQG